VEDFGEGSYDSLESSTRQPFHPSVGDMTLHVMNGTADEIKAQLLDSIDAFFDIYADVSSSTICD
jgi:hypothetical protein